MTSGGGDPLTLQSNCADRPSVASSTSSFRVKSGFLDGITRRVAVQVSFSVPHKWEKEAQLILIRGIGSK